MEGKQRGGWRFSVLQDAAASELLLVLVSSDKLLDNISEGVAHIVLVGRVSRPLVLDRALQLVELLPHQLGILFPGIERLVGQLAHRLLYFFLCELLDLQSLVNQNLVVLFDFFLGFLNATLQLVELNVVHFVQLFAFSSFLLLLLQVRAVELQLRLQVPDVFLDRRLLCLDLPFYVHCETLLRKFQVPQVFGEELVLFALQQGVQLLVFVRGWCL